MPNKTKSRRKKCRTRTQKIPKPPKFTQTDVELERFTPFEHKVESNFKNKQIDFNSVNYSLEKQLLHDFKQAISPSDITPQNDYYSYINERWLLELSIEKKQEYIVQVDNFRLTQDKVYLEILDIVDEHTSGASISNHAIQMKNLQSSLVAYRSNSTSQAYALQTLQMIDTLISDSTSTVWTLLGDINKNELTAQLVRFLLNG